MRLDRILEFSVGDMRALRRSVDDGVPLRHAPRMSRKDDTEHLRTVLAERVARLDLEQLQRLQDYMAVIERTGHIEDKLPNLLPDDSRRR
jgi:hypothetical protein